MGMSAWTVAKRNGSIAERVRDLPSLVQAALRGRLLVDNHGMLMQTEEDRADSLAFVRLAAKLNKRLQEETSRRKTEASRLELERSAPLRRHQAIERAKLQAAEEETRREAEERDQRIRARAEEIANGP